MSRLEVGVRSRPGSLECQRKVCKVSIVVVGMSMQMLRGKSMRVVGRDLCSVGFWVPNLLGREEVVMVSAHTQPPDFRIFFSPGFPLWDSS